MAAGLPVVSSLVMGVPEVVEDGESGLLVAPGRPDLLAKAIHRLADRGELRGGAGGGGRSAGPAGRGDRATGGQRRAAWAARACRQALGVGRVRSRAGGAGTRR